MLLRIQRRILRNRSICSMVSTSSNVMASPIVSEEIIFVNTDATTIKYSNEKVTASTQQAAMQGSKSKKKV